METTVDRLYQIIGVLYVETLLRRERQAVIDAAVAKAVAPQDEK